MSHYARLKSTYRDKAALVAALERSGVPKDAIRILDTPTPLSGNGQFMANVVVSKESVGTYSDIGFLVADKPGMVSSVSIDAFAWKDTNLKGFKGQHESGAWLNRVRMEYDCEVTIKKHRSLCHQAQRVNLGDRIVVAIKA